MIDETLEALRLYLAGDLDFEALERLTSFNSRPMRRASTEFS